MAGKRNFLTIRHPLLQHQVCSPQAVKFEVCDYIHVHIIHVSFNGLITYVDVHWEVIITAQLGALE